MSEKPIKTSTPVFPKKRPPIREDLEKNSYSPIYSTQQKMTDSDKESPNKVSKSPKKIPKSTTGLKVAQKDGEQEESSSDEVEEPETEIEDNKDKSDILPKNQQQNSNAVVFYLFGTLILFLSFILIHLNASNEEKVSLDEIKRNFPAQSADLWLALNSALNDIQTFDKPANLMLLYEEKSAATLENLLREISHYSICILKDCRLSPIVLTAQLLNSTNFQRDYGNLIDYFKPELAKKAVMIVQNLENVNGQTAQAFHSFCDEFTPLVERALFIFTVQTDDFGGNSLDILEEYFKNKWTDIKRDNFYALFTRITSMPLEILPESA